MASEVDEKGIPAAVRDLVAETDEALALEAEVDEVVASEAETDEVATSEAETNEVATSEAETNEVATSEAETNEVATSEAETNEVATSEAETNEVATSEAETNEVATSEAETGPRDNGRLIPRARQEDLFLDQFDQVRLETFLAYPDPRSDFESITKEAFTRAFIELSAEASDNEVYEKVMDAATQLAHDDQQYFAERHGFHAVQIPSLVDLFGFQDREEFHAWLTVVDSIETQSRAVYHLRDVYGMTNQEASNVLGISPSWASKLYTRAEIHLTSAGVSVEELKECFFNVEIKRR